MEHKTDDLRIKEIKELVAPVDLLGEFSITLGAADTVWEARQEIHRILHGADDRLLVIIGPCSIHDVKAAKEFAARLRETNLQPVIPCAVLSNATVYCRRSSNVCARKTSELLIKRNLELSGSGVSKI